MTIHKFYKAISAACIAVLLLSFSAPSATAQSKAAANAKSGNARISALTSKDPQVRVIQPKTNDADTYFMEAMKAMENGDDSQASDYFRKTLQADPTCSAALFYLAGISESANKLVDAEDYYRKAIALDSTNFWYKYYLANLYAHTDRKELTIGIYNDLLKQYPKKSQLYFNLINLYLSDKQIDKALETLDKIEETAGKSEMIGLTGFQLRLEKGDEKAAVDYLTEYYKDCPGAKTAITLGDYCMSNYREDEAFKYYDQAVQMEPDNPMAYYGRAHAEQALRHYEDYFHDIGYFLGSKEIDPQAKVQYMNQLFQQQQFAHAFPIQMDSLMNVVYASAPKDTTVGLFYAYYLHQNNRSDDAIKVLQDNIVANPDNFTNKLQLVVYYYQAEDWQSVKDASHVIEIQYPKAFQVFQMEGYAYMQTKDWDAAIECMQKMMKAAPKDTAVQLAGYSSLGDIYHELNNPKKSYQYYDKALRINPKYNPVLNNYAYYLCLDKKNLNKAYKMSKVTIDSEPDNPTYLDTFGWILFLQGKNTEAKAIFKHAMLYGGKDKPDIIDHYAEVLYSLKEYELAFIYWNQAAAADPEGGYAEKLRQRKAAIGR
jgi:tetratricopeptide (TPR) repeat protein